MARVEFRKAAPLRPGAIEPSRYTAPSSLHPGALWLAAAAPFAAILMLIGAR